MNGSDDVPGDHTVRLGARTVGAGAAPYVIAEVSANHRGSIDHAQRIIRAAADAGADAIKLQTFTPSSMTLDLDEPRFVAGSSTLWAGRTLHSLYEEAQTPWEWHAPLFAAAAELGLDHLSTPFDRDAVDFLEQFDPIAHKIASFELLDLELIAHAAATGRPVILSTGMATIDEIDDAVTAARSAGDGGVVLLRCNSAYPADPAEMDLGTIDDMRTRWGVPVGLSDHTLGQTVAIAATAMGAAVIEKHVTISRADGGPDAEFSTEPGELAELVEAVRLTARARGGVRYGASTTEAASLAFRRTLHVVEDVAAGEELTRANIRAIRPGGGLAPKRLGEVLGRRAPRDLARGTPVTEDLLR